jgi:hypothetical protein
MGWVFTPGCQPEGLCRDHPFVVAAVSTASDLPPAARRVILQADRNEPEDKD